MFGFRAKNSGVDGREGPVWGEEPLFDEDFPVLLENLAILVRKRLAGLLSGVQRSRQHGAGFEFADHRAYQPGDDLRRLDWNVAARSERWVIRRFEEEQDLHVHIVVDVSQSMLGGRSEETPSCLRRALRMAAALSFAALVHQDPVSLYLVDDSIRGRFGPVRGRGRILRVLDFLSQAVPGQKTDAAAAIKEIVTAAPRKGLLVYLTDGYDAQGTLHGLAMARHHGFEVSVIQISDRSRRFERVLGDLEIVDAETGEILHLTLTPQMIDAICAAERGHAKRIQAGARKLGVTVQERSIQEDFVDSVLRALMGQGAGRGAHSAEGG